MEKKYFFGALTNQLSIILFILLSAIAYYIKLANFYELITGTLIFFLGHLLLTKFYLSSSQFQYNCSVFLTFIINIIIINLFVLLNTNYNYINNFLNNKTYTTYNLVVLKKQLLIVPLKNLPIKKLVQQQTTK